MKIGMRGARAAAVVGVLCLATAASAADYWVKNGGSNGADGLSVATAWAALPPAAAAGGAGDPRVEDGRQHGRRGAVGGDCLGDAAARGRPGRARRHGARARRQLSGLLP